ncbi:MAG: transglycosylase domain-containing protein, partial [Verrucomicrobiales bacterium]
PMFSSSQHPQAPQNYQIYKKRIWEYRWLQWLLIVAVLATVVGLTAAVFFLKPFKEQAAAYDLEEVHKLETASVIYDRKGEEIGRIYVENRRPIGIDEVPFYFVQALVATEDSRYFVHKGVDYYGIARAMVRNFMEGGIVQGGSTITQQLARNTFSLQGRSYSRKLLEAFVAMRIEEQFSKVEIMELYLNRIYFGGGFYGINAAAQGYFGKPASALSLAESATLCGLIKSPNRLSPLRNPELSREARDRVFVRMRSEKMISREQYQQLLSEPLVVSPRNADNQHSYVYETIRQKVIELIGYEQASRGGFQIYSTIDQGVQGAADESLRKRLAIIEQTPGYEHQTLADYEQTLESFKADGDDADNARKAPAPDYLQGALLMIDNQTGAIVSMIGGRDYRHSEFNRALQARRPPGTAFKPFVYAAAFADGMFPGTPVNDAPIDNRRVMIGGTEGILGEWGVESADNFHEGEITARRALVESKVAATVRLGLEMESGVDKVIALARRAGIQSPMREYPSSFIGSSELFLSELALAYTIFPNGGVRPRDLYIISSIVDSEGITVFQAPETERELLPAIDPISAYQVHSCLAQVLEKGTARKASSSYGLSEDFIGGGKTGTAYNFTDNCFVGYTRELTCAVWTGFDRPRPIYRGAFSNVTVLPVWVDTINAALASRPATAINPPEDALALEICDRSGLLATDACYQRDSRVGETQRFTRSTHVEYVRPTRKLTEHCTVHG